jgi:hypothetical protein
LHTHNCKPTFAHPQYFLCLKEFLLVHPTSLLAPFQLFILTCTYILRLICSHVPAECKSIISYYKMMKQPFIISFSVYQSTFTLSHTALTLTWYRVLSLSIYTSVQKECLVLGTMLHNTVKLGFYIPWLYFFHDSTHVLIGSTTASVGMWHFPWMYICSSYPVAWIYAQIEHEPARCSHFKFFQLGIKKKYPYVSYIFLSLLSACHMLDTLCTVK